MVCVRAAGDRIDHRFRIAVIGGDDPGAAARAQALENSAEAFVDRFDGFDGGLELSGVADHVRVGEVHDDRVEIALFDGVDHGVGNSRRGHFRLQIVCGHFGRGNQRALLAGKRLFDAAVEEISDVGVLLGFRDAQVLVLPLREDIGQDVLELFGSEDVAQPGPGFFVLRHGDVDQILRAAMDRQICRSLARPAPW